MDGGYKPDGYNSVSPYSVARNAQATIEFPTKAFDATELRGMTGPDGGIFHAEVRVNEGVVMNGEGGADFPPMPAHIPMYVPNADAAYERVLAAGASSVQTPMQKDNDDKRGGVHSVDGDAWWITRKVD